MAKHGKARKLFEKNVAPLLYLAGFEVSVIKTEREGQAKQYMDVLEHTDYLVVAGGDGTLQEVVTGLLRRTNNTLDNVPIGVLPLGVVNSFACAMFGDREKELVRWLLDSGMAIVRGLVKSANVIRITSDEEKTVYALSGVDCGIHRKAIDRVNKQQKYWYLGPIKHRITLLRGALIDDWPPLITAEMTYSHVCSGCNRCRPVPEWKWWHILFKPKFEDFTKVVNEECGVQHNKLVSDVQMMINCPNAQTSDQVDGMKMSVTETVNRMDFIKHGMSLIGEKPYSDKHHLRDVISNIQSITLRPSVEKGTVAFYSIDNEDFESMPIHLSLLKNKIRIFTPPSAPL